MKKELTEAQRKKRRLQALKYRRDKKLREEKAKAFWAKPSLPSQPGTRLLTPRGPSTKVYTKPVCGCCQEPLELVTSTLGILIFGFSSRWVEGETEYVITPPPDATVLEVETMKRVSRPISKRVRVCPKCVSKLDKIIPEWENGQLHKGTTENFDRRSKVPPNRPGFRRL